MIKRGDGEWIAVEFKLGSQELIRCYAVLVAAWWEDGQFYTDEAVEVGRVEYRYDAGQVYVALTERGGPSSSRVSERGVGKLEVLHVRHVGERCQQAGRTSIRSLPTRTT